ncbi:hypothetical protein OAA09_01295, partial [bacterium]|nr:hypothetical protein [bacterium]
SYFVNFAASIVEKMATALENLGGPKSQGATAKAFSRLGAAWKRFFVALWPHIKKLLAFLMSEIWAWMKANPGKAILIGMLLMGNMFGPTVLMYAASALVGGLYGALKSMGGNLLKVGRYIGGKLVSGVKHAWKGLKGLGSSLKKMVTKPFRRGKNVQRWPIYERWRPSSKRRPDGWKR